MRATQSRFLVISCLMMLSACMQGRMAEVYNKGNQFFGRVDVSSDMAMRMPQNPAIAPKYQSAQPEFAAAAALDHVETKTIDLPPPVSAKPLAVMQAPRAIESGKIASLAPLPATPSHAETLPPKTLPVATPPASLSSIQPAMNAAATKTSFIWPTDGNVISAYGPKPNGLINDGINIAAAEGKPIWAAAGGEVVYAGNELKGYGNMMIIRHAGGWMSAYAHASDMLVKKGSVVKQGDLIGYVGKTGDVDVAQLHFGIRQGKAPVNPESLLPRRVASVN